MWRVLLCRCRIDRALARQGKDRQIAFVVVVEDLGLAGRNSAGWHRSGCAVATMNCAMPR